MKFVKPIIALLLFCMSANLHAQREITDRGTFSYVIPKNVTLDQAEVFAVESAKLSIIADNFGTVVGSNANLLISNRGGVSSVESLILAGTEVRGDWIATIGEPKITRKVVNNEFVLDVTIQGRIREIVSAPIEFHARVLRNGVTDNCVSERFNEGDRMYISFQTPEDGYLSIYMTDGTIVQCLFPYDGLSAEHMEVQAGRRHVFFSKDHSGDIDPFMVKDLTVSCNTDNEHDRIYMIFSPHKYAKAVDYSNESVMLRELSFEEFHSWLSRLRRMDKDLTYKAFDIIINR